MAQLDRVYEIDPVLRGILDGVLVTDSWTRKAVGMQIVLEGLALASFRNLGRVTEEPLLKALLRLVTQDEARHTGYGIKYLEHVIPTLPEAERGELEDFAFESARLMMDQRTGGMGQKIFGIFHEEGLDVAGGLAELNRRRDEIRAHIVAERRKAGFDADPLRGFVVPTLAKIGLFSERIVPKYRDLIERNMITGFEGTIFDGTFALPDDLEAWVEETGR